MGLLNAYPYLLEHLFDIRHAVRTAVELGESDHPRLAGVTIGAGGVQFSDTVWDDIRIVPSAFDFAGNADPANVATSIGNMTFRLFEFAAADEAFCVIQMPHSYKRGTTLRPHVHWTPGTRGNEERGKTVAWKMQISAAHYGAVFSNAETVDLTHTVPADALDGIHLITSSADFVPPASFGESGMLLIRIYRDTGDTWAGTATGSLPLLLEVDIHHQIDKVGSANEIPS
jgi:hypothetical protein